MHSHWTTALPLTSLLPGTARHFPELPFVIFMFSLMALAVDDENSTDVAARANPAAPIVILRVLDMIEQ
ncbi:hypothetical protein SBD_7947 [Streptomyces bottropensis ATCC 25435]|uniref:Uncharacterized protein n=1 Tax=Streptomyces bottropensis ATCC 25435 TaxID=1054862 RepID=M3EMY1_9ACTN|nr:hypothetical protein SBD_7947 [Streptomyces bottropensis ATCC 25435]